MNIKGYKKIYAIIGLVLYLCTYSGLTVSAQTLPDYTVLAPLPGTTQDCNQNDPNANCKTNLKTYLEGMFKLLIGVSAILAFVMLVYAGFLYTTSEGVGQTTNARSKIEDAIWGLVLVIGAYAILNTINPKILEFNLSIKRPELRASVQGGSVTLTRSKDIVYDSCSTCVKFSDLQINTSGSADGTGIESSFAKELSTLNSSLPKYSWTVTEGWPPSINHQDPCHKNGTCVDAALKEPTPANIIDFLNKSKSAGLNSTYEVTTQAELDALKAANVPIVLCASGGGACLNVKATGQHFHIKP
ncbi:MAG: hypothetical protein QG589_254 [Patescibacteria group bacterium]|nr:hypothetical protein [Patescibacteria group bacterium]